MIIGVDVDGVLRDFTTSLIRVYRHRFPDHSIGDYNEWQWDTINNFPQFEYGKSQPHRKRLMREFVFNTHVQDIMVNAEPFPNAVEALNDLYHNTHHQVYIVTNQYKGSEHHTLEWLGRNGVQAKKVIFEQHKLRANCDVLIDDKIENLEDYLKGGKGAIAIARPWNRHWKKTKAVKGLEQAVELLKNI